MKENEIREELKNILEREDIETTESREAQIRLRKAYTSPWDIARQTTKIGRQGSQSNNGLDDEEEQT